MLQKPRLEVFEPSVKDEQAMESKFIVVNNGMTGLRGHYFETGVSIAREAQRRGLKTALAAHATFDAKVLPPDLEFYPLFRVDHWGAAVAAEVPGLHGLRCCVSALRETTIEDVLDGSATMEQYLLARFEPLRKESVAAPTTTPPRARIKDVIERVLPPIVLPPVRRLVRLRHRGRDLAVSFVPPILHDRLRRLRRAPIPDRSSRIVSAHSGEASCASASRELGATTYLRNALSRANAENEADLWPLFLRDLDRMLCLAEVGPGDHVFFPTAHGREAYAIRRLIEEIGEDRSPVFHLEFRHPIATLDELDTGVQEPWMLRYTLIHQAFFDACRAYPATTRMRYYTDTDELAADYGQLAGADFDVLPIPFRTELIPKSSTQEDIQVPLKLLFLGDVREEKGFELLPGLARALFKNYLKPGKIQFVIQASIHQDEPSRAVRDALKELEQYDRKYVDIISKKAFVSPEEYYGLLASSHLVLLPYRARNYRARSSGVLAEAIAAGKPTIVTAGTWLSGQQPLGSGETFTDEASFAEAVRSVCDRYPEYKARALLARELWQRRHSPGCLIDCLIGRQMHSRANAA
jgi:glycosyltransferase involved in cell wall biosynthesis